MINLAVVDTLILFVWSNQIAVSSVCRYFRRCPFYERVKLAVWIYVWPFGTTFQLMGTWSIVSITFSRFVSVCWPSRARQVNGRCRVVARTVVMHATCVALSSLRFAESYVVYDGRGRMAYRRTALGDSAIYRYLYEIALYYLTSYVAPLSLLLYFTVRLSLSLREVNRKRQTMSRKAKERSDLTFSLIVVVVVFIFCQLANPVRRLLYVIYAPRRLGCGTPYFYFSSWSVALVNVNSAGNFFIFCLCCPGFRRQLKQMLCERGRIEPVGLSTTANSADVHSTVAEITTHGHM